MGQDYETLFREAGGAHHQAYLETDGADPEWPLWYARYLYPKLGPHFPTLTESELVYHLVLWDRSHRADAPDQPWPEFYAGRLSALGVTG